VPGAQVNTHIHTVTLEPLQDGFGELDERIRINCLCFPSFAYTVAAVLLSTLVRPLKLHGLKGQVAEVRSELVSTPKEETWITVGRRS